MALLENKRIRLRALEPEDLDLLYRWENETEWWGVGNTLAPFSRYLLKEYIASSHHDIFELKQLRLIVELVADRTVVGMVDLYDFEPHHRRAGVGILIDSQYQGSGLGSEALTLLMDYAFSFLRLHQLYVHVPVLNEPSHALFARCGFIVTGKFTDWLATPEGYVDVFMMQRMNGRPILAPVVS
ncbi:MAG: GNAT family protein [Tannerellaceae bacterium]